MPLDPQVQAVLDKIRDAGNAEYWQMTPQQARDWHNRKAGILDVKPERVFKTSDRSIPGLAGAIPVRIFVPRQAAEALPELAGNRAASAPVVARMQSLRPRDE